MPPSRSVGARIFRATAAVIAAGIAVKAAATLKEFVVAGIYGRSDAMDAFLVALLIPNLLINVFGESMSQALVPTLVRVRVQQGRERAAQLLSRSMVSLCLLLTLACVVMAAGARLLFPLIGSNFNAAKIDLSIHLFYVLLPVVILGGLAANLTSVLNTAEKFALPALAPLAITAATIAGTLVLHRSLGIWALAYATVAGFALHLLLVGGMMRGQGLGLQLRGWSAMPESREVARQYGPVVFSAVVASAGLLVDQAMAAMLPAGSVSALVFAGRFVSVAVSLLGGAVASAVTPYFSDMAAHRDWELCRASIRKAVRTMALISVPLAMGLMAVSRPLVRLVLEHGAFTAKDTAVVAPTLAMYAIQIPFFVVSRIHYRHLLAVRRTDLILYCGAINLILDIGLNLVLMRYLGVAGIALATSIWSIGTFAFLWFWSRRILAAAIQSAPARVLE